MKFKVFDDFLPPTYVNLLESLFSCEEKIPGIDWQFQKHMDDAESGYPQYLVGIYCDGGDNPNSNLLNENNVGSKIIYYTITGLISYIMDAIIPEYVPDRIRGVKQYTIEDSIAFYPPHTDTLDDGEISLIYYPTDCTGDTYLFKEFDIENKVKYDRFEHNWEPTDRVSPKKGRLIMFPSNYYHAGSPPDRDFRTLINFNFLHKDIIRDRKVNNS